MDRLWRPSKVLSLQDLCCRAVVSCTPVHLVDKLPLPLALRSHLKSFSMANGLNARMMHGRSYSVTLARCTRGAACAKARRAAAPEPTPALCPEQLQSLLGGGSGAPTADSGGLRPPHGSREATPGQEHWPALTVTMRSGQ
ncbi:hypothetical protein QTO34_008623 [Cnephaeus nilssonii]|uniref:SOCS box domain-containing protein n=1 Tax=Cnephaeus nilssonii TaxID=3371016 RepID=A0AA40HG94_CNENI|nr:hypothetical protein QTO34_008623 [Eptesicus nilssonii]